MAQSINCPTTDEKVPGSTPGGVSKFSVLSQKKNLMDVLTMNTLLSRTECVPFGPILNDKASHLDV